MLQCCLCDLRIHIILLIYVICSVPVFVKTLLQTHLTYSLLKALPAKPHELEKELSHTKWLN